MVTLAPVPGQVTCDETVEAEQPAAVAKLPLLQFAPAVAPAMGSVHCPVVVLNIAQPLPVVAAAYWVHWPVVWLKSTQPPVVAAAVVAAAYWVHWPVVWLNSTQPPAPAAPALLTTPFVHVCPGCSAMPTQLPPTPL